LTLGLLLSTRLSGMVCGIIAVVLFGIAWIGEIGGGIEVASDNATIPAHVAPDLHERDRRDTAFRGTAAFEAAVEGFFARAGERAPGRQTAAAAASRSDGECAEAERRG